jgi:hypothetical protein
MLLPEDLVDWPMVEELKGSWKHIQSVGIQQSILCHQVCDEGLWWNPKTALHLKMKKLYPKKQRRFHVGQRSRLDDGAGSS